jgi:hypothetical protein
MSPHRRAVWLGAILTIFMVCLGASYSGIAEVRDSMDVQTAETLAHIKDLQQGILRYVATMGSVPSKLSDLWVKDTQPELAFSPSLRVGAGWLGPYLSVVPVERIDFLKEDPFGKDLEYLAARFRRPEDNREVVVRIRSAGPDGIPHNADDIVSDMLASSLFSRISGRVLRNSKPAARIKILLSTPINGVPTQVSAITGDLGGYVFDNVPFGHRSISVGGASAFLNIQVANAEIEAPALHIRGF